MRQWKRSGLWIGAASLCAALLSLSPAAEAHGRGGGRPVVRSGMIFRGFGPAYIVSPWFGFGPGFGYRPYFGYGPYLDPYWGYAGADPRLDSVQMSMAMMTGWGAIDLNVKPNRADVWVDGRYLGEARDLDGYPQPLWLEQGPHRIAVYKAGFKTFEDAIQVERGVRRELKLRLEPGESLPPGPKPGDKKPDREDAKPAPKEDGGAVD